MGNALTPFSKSPYTAANFDEKTVSNSVDKDSYPSLIYAEMAGLTDWKVDAEIQVEIRSDKDPYFLAQGITQEGKASSFKTGCLGDPLHAVQEFGSCFQRKKRWRFALLWPNPGRASRFRVNDDYHWLHHLGTHLLRLLHHQTSGQQAR